VGLDDNPFAVQRTRDGLLLISRGNQVVVTLGGERALRVAQALDTAPDEEACQQILARATGNYRHGNERQNSRR
jgi:hypothetical protein